MEDIKTLLKEQEERIKKHITQEVKTHIDVLKEDFDSKVALIVEQYDLIIKRLDAHDEKFASIDKKLDSYEVKFVSIDEKLTSHEKRLDSIDKKLDSHEKRLASIEKKLDSHEVRLASIESKLVSIEKDIEIMKVDISFIKNSLKKKVDVEEFEALEKRVAILEAKMRGK
jgi:chromosome segregation ATPase